MKKYIHYIPTVLLSFVWVNFGLFAGLQISPLIGSVVLFPFVVAAFFLDTGFGYFPGLLKLALYLLTIGFWAWAGLRIWQMLFQRVK